jgi:hypothetical protein
MWVVSDAARTARRRYAVEEAFACAEGDRCDVGAEFVDEAGGEVLVDRGGAAGDGDVAVSRPCAPGRGRRGCRR